MLLSLLLCSVELASLFTGCLTASGVGVTGSVNLSGSLDAVCGLQPKITGALRHGVKSVVLPLANVKDGRVVDVDDGADGSVLSMQNDPFVPVRLGQRVCEGLTLFAADTVFDCLDLVLDAPHRRK